MSQYTATIRKLQNALNDKFDAKILYNRTQFYSEQAQKPVTLLVIKQVIWDDAKGKGVQEELFSSTSEIQIVLWLRDYWYELNGWEVPTDNQMWNEAKARYLQRRAKRNE